MSRALLIKNGNLIDPASRVDGEFDLLLRDGRVIVVGKCGEVAANGAEILDAKGLIVAPGFIDIHVHFREPGQQHKETIQTGSRAAAAGGFTSVCCMPNTTPVNDSAEVTRWMLSVDRKPEVNIFAIAAATAGSLGARVTDFPALKDAGAIAFSDDGKPILEDDIMEECLRRAKQLGVPVIQHAEDTRMTGGCSMHLGPTSFRLGLRGMSVESESQIVERDIALARKTGGHLHVAHLSTRKALEAVRRAKRDGVRVTCEVTPHHFTLIDEHVGDYNTHYKMCPPLRSAEDRDAMLEGLLDGSIDCIATDHAPHAHHEKQQEFERAPMGITGLETSLPIALQVLHHHGKLPLSRMVDLMSANPAELMGLKDRGTLRKGAHADVVVFDPKAKWRFEAVNSRSRSKNTPFDGWDFQGKVAATVVGGKIVFDSRKS